MAIGKIMQEFEAIIAGFLTPRCLSGKCINLEGFCCDLSRRHIKIKASERQLWEPYEALPDEYVREESFEEDVFGLGAGGHGAGISYVGNAGSSSVFSGLEEFLDSDKRDLFEEDEPLDENYRSIMILPTADRDVYKITGIGLCPQLELNGKCGIYEKRPEDCKNYPVWLGDENTIHLNSSCHCFSEPDFKKAITEFIGRFGLDVKKYRNHV